MSNNDLSKFFDQIHEIGGGASKKRRLLNESTSTFTTSAPTTFSSFIQNRSQFPQPQFTTSAPTTFSSFIESRSKFSASPFANSAPKTFSSFIENRSKFSAPQLTTFAPATPKQSILPKTIRVSSKVDSPVASSVNQPKVVSKTPKVPFIVIEPKQKSIVSDSNVNQKLSSSIVQSQIVDLTNDDDDQDTNNDDFFSEQELNDLANSKTFFGNFGNSCNSDSILAIMFLIDSDVFRRKILTTNPGPLLDCSSTVTKQIGRTLRQNTRNLLDSQSGMKICHDFRKKLSQCTNIFGGKTATTLSFSSPGEFYEVLSQMYNLNIEQTTMQLLSGQITKISSSTINVGSVMMDRLWDWYNNLKNFILNRLELDDRFILVMSLEKWDVVKNVDGKMRSWPPSDENELLNWLNVIKSENKFDLTSESDSSKRRIINNSLIATDFSKIVDQYDYLVLLAADVFQIDPSTQRVNRDYSKLNEPSPTTDKRMRSNSLTEILTLGPNNNNKQYELVGVVYNSNRNHIIAYFKRQGFWFLYDNFNQKVIKMTSPSSNMLNPHSIKINQITYSLIPELYFYVAII